MVLTNADIDHVAGLLTLRERGPFSLFATKDVLHSLAANPIFGVLADDMVTRRAVEMETSFEPVEGVCMTLFAVPGKVPLWSEAGEVETGIADGRTVGVEICPAVPHGPAPDDGHTQKTFYIPGCAHLPPALASRLAGADIALFDGTLFRDDEMILAGLGVKTGRRMGHMPISGPGGTLDAFANIAVRRKILIHINNSNPVLIDGSPERREVAAGGWEVAEDGMEMALCEA